MRLLQKLTAEKLAKGIKECLTEEARQNVNKLANGILHEGNGAENAVKSFQRQLPVGREGQNVDMRCEILPDRVAVWLVKDKKRTIRLSALAAELLVENKKLKWNQLRLIRHCEWNDFGGPGEPITSIGSAVSGTATELAGGVSNLPVGVAKTVKARGRREKKRRELEKRTKEKHEWQRKDQQREQDDTRNAETSSTSRTSIEIARDKQQKPSPEREKGSDEDVAATDQSRNTEPSKSSEESSSQPTPLPNTSAEHTILTDLSRNDSGHQNAPQPPRCASDPSNVTLSSEKSVPRNLTRVPNRTSTLGSTLSAGPLEALPTEVTGLTGQSAVQAASAIAALPIDLALAVAQGFHNAPRLYGDETVRRPTRITGWHSGMRAARLEFGYGIRDGWTGLASQPRMGWKKGFSGESAGAGDKALGELEGVGKGLGGLVLKNISAVVGPSAFVAQGLRKEVAKGRQPTGRIRQARMADVKNQIDAEKRRERPSGEAKVDRDSLEREVLSAWSLKRDSAMSGKRGTESLSRGKDEKNK